MCVRARVCPQTQVRQQCLTVLLRLITMSSSDQLATALKNVRICSFIATLLSSRDTTTQAIALVLSEVLMAKLPAVFKNYFLKEGLLQALRQMAERGKGSVGAASAPAAAAAAAPTPAAAGAGGSSQGAEGEGEPSSSRRGKEGHSSMLQCSCSCVLRVLAVPTR